MSGGPAAELSITRITKDEEWLLAHMADPVAIAPGVRTDTDPAPPPLLTRLQAQSVLAYLRTFAPGRAPPQISREDRLAAGTFATLCAGCHKISGEGGESGPDLSSVGARRDAARSSSSRDPTGNSRHADAALRRAAERAAAERSCAVPREPALATQIGSRHPVNLPLRAHRSPHQVKIVTFQHLSLFALMTAMQVTRPSLDSP